jgi:RNA polymerase sigma-70 factor (ECF subfamily)
MLPDRQRVAIVLCYYEGLDNQEAATCMSLGLGAYQQLLHRAKHSLRTKLGERK